MMVFKRVFASKIFQLGLSAALIYFAFRKVNVVQIFTEISQVKWWIVGLLLIYMALTILIGGYRWAVLVLGKVSLREAWDFSKATWAGAFYSLFFPSAVGGDLLKWTTLINKYPQISKMKLAGTALIDRVIGFSAFSLAAMLALIAGRFLGYPFPMYLFWLFLGINIAMILGYVMVFTLDFEKILGRYRLTSKLLEVVDLLKTSNKGRIIKCFLISLVGEPFWMAMVWFASLIFGAGINFLDVLIFMPVIATILTLPISWAGFGARENLFLYFFGQLGLENKKLLLVSTFVGLMGVINALVGGIILLIDNIFSKRKVINLEKR